MIPKKTPTPTPTPNPNTNSIKTLISSSQSPPYRHRHRHNSSLAATTSPPPAASPPPPSATPPTASPTASPTPSSSNSPLNTPLLLLLLLLLLTWRNYYHYQQTPPYLSINQIIPFLRFAHLTANQAILESSVGVRAGGGGQVQIHIVDLHTSHGLQWPPLLQALAHLSDPPASVCITGAGPDPAALLRTAHRLRSFARSLRLNIY